MKRRLLILIVLLYTSSLVHAQLFPGEGDNIDYLVTSGSKAGDAVGDDDHQQVVFFLIPKNYEAPFYIRVFDPETGGTIDEISNGADTKTTYSVYSGNGSLSDSLSRVVSYQSKIKGNLLKTRSFTNEDSYDNKWYSFGPFNPKKGEYSDEFSGYVFKIVINGTSGDDANLYKLALSSGKSSNVPITGGNIFTYEYSFRLKSQKQSIGHVYPYMDKEIVSIRQHNFDVDNDATIRLYSAARKGELAPVSNNGVWKSSKHSVDKNEKGKCLDVQIRKKASWHNDMVMYILNQYNEAVPFFASPIGGSVKPKFSFKSEK